MQQRRDLAVRGATHGFAVGGRQRQQLLCRWGVLVAVIAERPHLVLILGR
jgi:hypothetical protein